MMAFRGNIKPERWNRILNPMDDLSRVVISRVSGEKIFNYDYTWRMNNFFIGSFIAFLVRANIEHGLIINLCWDIFNLT